MSLEVVFGLRLSVDECTVGGLDTCRLLRLDTPPAGRGFNAFWRVSPDFSTQKSQGVFYHPSGKDGSEQVFLLFYTNHDCANERLGVGEFVGALNILKTRILRLHTLTPVVNFWRLPAGEHEYSLNYII